MKYFAQLALLALVAQVALASEEEKKSTQKTEKRGVHGLGNAGAFGSFGARGFGGAGWNLGDSATFSNAIPLSTPLALGAPWPSAAPGGWDNAGWSGFGPQGSYGTPNVPGAGWNVPVLAPASYNKRVTLAAGLSSPDILSATADAHSQYAAPYSASGAPYSQSLNAGWSKYGGGCRC